MIILHFHLHPQFKYELFHIYTSYQYDILTFFHSWNDQDANPWQCVKSGKKMCKECKLALDDRFYNKVLWPQRDEV